MRLLSFFIILPTILGVRNHACDDPCLAGNCRFADCSEAVDCPGGLCEFHNCNNAICTGGACSFYECSHPTCPGGGCKFHDPKTTLLDGYCDGGACHLNGVPWSASFKNQLSF
mmetsp:Transcript_28594/g.33791  ORF Transcript_28594/g.33791 Transcript_28594/m.33791 type:complete len:113 (-) Transcript_28594:135-473(-)